MFVRSGIVSVLCVFSAWAGANSPSVKSVSALTTTSSSEIQLAISAVNEIEALNNGLLDARVGVFNPLVPPPGMAVKPAASLSKSEE